MYNFDYQRPADRAGAAAAAKSSDARFLAGGQTLIQAMKMRLSSSERLVDLGGIADLKDVKALCEAEGEGILGAITGRAIYEGTLDFAEAQRLADKIAGENVQKNQAGA